jgi:4-hydroxy-tetrahydrodipicolinate reductase
MEGEAAHYCPNDTACPPQLKGKIEHFISRDAMNIESLGPETIEDYFNRGLIHDVSDLYNIRITDICGADRSRERSARKIIEGIEASKQIPIFYSANMSIGVSLLVELAKKTAAAMPNADIEIIEKHHNRKVDAPSGTALMLFEEIRTVREDAVAKLGRSGQCKRTTNEIGVHALRMGNVVGEHEVIVCTPNQTITLKHEAHNRALFAEGALTAVPFIVKQGAGIYNMKDMLKD